MHANAPNRAASEGRWLMPFPRVLTKVFHGRLNRITLRFAGHAAFADLEHVGRRSGTAYHTPVRAFRVGDTVVVGINFGTRSDWFRNITRAGTCRLASFCRPDFVEACA